MVWDDDENKGGNGKGPWGSRDPGTGDKPKGPWDQQRPGGANEVPDLDEVLRHAQNKIGSIFGGKPSHGEEKKGIGLLFLLVLALWLGTGFYRVSPGENVVLLTFGKWTSTRAESGLGYHIPWPVQTVIPVNVAFDRRVQIGFTDQPGSRGSDDSSAKSDVASESTMLTGDENIVDIDFVVMWKIGDAKNYLFRIRDPETTVKRVAESAMREIIGRSEIQKALTEGRADIEASTKELMQKILDQYQSGIVINSVQLLSVDPPAPVVDAFDDVQRARADMVRTQNEAETYRNDIVPRARGEAQKLLQDAEAYKQAVLSKATGEAARFTSVYEAYAQAKDVTAKRIYIETMEKIMHNSKKVVVSDSKTGSNVLPYMSLDRLQRGDSAPAASAATPAPAAQQ